MYKLYGVIILIIVPGAVIGCKKASPESTLTLGAQYSFDPDQSWTSLTPEQLDESQNQAVRGLLEESTPIGAVYLGDRVRVYNVTGRWRPMTLTVLNDANSPIDTIRIDLPPTGIVRAPLPYPSDNTSNPILLRLTEPSLDTDFSEETIHVMPIDRQIGIPAKEFTPDIVKKLGFTGADRYDIDDIDIRSYTAWLSPDKWKCIVLADRTYSVASHNGNNGQPPTETWWARTVSEDIQSIKQND